MHTIKYDNITTLVEEIMAAPSGDITIVMPEGAMHIQTSFVALQLHSKNFDGISVLEDLNTDDGMYAFLVKKA